MEITGHPQDETVPAAEQPDPASEPDLTEENTVSAAESEAAPAVSADASAAAETPSDTEETWTIWSRLRRSCFQQNI